jgi:acetolactate synthase-1/2/3 large subunit
VDRAQFSDLLPQWLHHQQRPRRHGHCANPDFKAYAESFGIKAQRPGSVSELRAAVAEAIGSRELRLIEIPIDPSVNRELVAKLRDFWSRKTPPPGSAKIHEALVRS